ncbi:MAG: DUF4242 domain-containing protein [Lysobacteraceae bacterium]|nr:MAG: DUF4242 domain-containing protein [Xanthomonadaceae bacterium]
MMPMRFFIDTHDREQETFPAALSTEQFGEFLSAYERACRDEGVVLMRVHTNLEVGRAFCMTLAPDADAVRRAHARVGLPFDSITEVAAAGPYDIFVAQR